MGHREHVCSGQARLRTGFSQSLWHLKCSPVGFGISAHRFRSRVPCSFGLSSLSALYPRDPKDSLCSCLTRSALSASQGVGLCGSVFRLHGSGGLLVDDGKSCSRMGGPACFCCASAMLVGAAPADAEAGRDRPDGWTTGRSVVGSGFDPAGNDGGFVSDPADRPASAIVGKVIK